MNKLVVSQRIAGIHARKPFGHIKGGPDLFRREQLVERMKGIEQAEVPFDIVYGKLSSNVESIYAMARQLKPECIYIDGAYLLSHPKERDRYIRVAENATLIKKELASLCPVVCSWQLSREAAKKKVKDVGLEDIGYSDAIGQLSSLVLSLLKEDGVETDAERIIYLLKGRNGESGEFRISWNFDQMDFTESVEISLEELQF